MANDVTRVFGLDLLRALAILFVVYEHGYRFIAHLLPENIYNLPVLDGVTIFFVLSGFLIGRILLRTLIQKDLGVAMLLEFWLRRWFRTLPNYFFVLGFIILAYHIQQLKSLPENLYLYFFFSQNIATPHPDFFPEAWSLTIEEWFYFATPIPLCLAFGVFKNVARQKIALYWITAVILTVTLFRGYRVFTMEHLTTNDWDLQLRKQVATRMDSLMIGVLGAYCSLFWPLFWGTHAKLLASLGLLLLLFDKVIVMTKGDSFFYIFYMKYCVFTTNPIGVLLLIPWLSAWKKSQGWLARAITLISLISYSLYLLNYTPVIGIILPMTMGTLAKVCFSCSQMALLQYFLFWTITFSGAYVLYRFFEKPMTALREKWHIKNARAIAVYEKP
jgi:peptidoglycan/LPS O-acetylase OafA/YrhL